MNGFKRSKYDGTKWAFTMDALNRTTEKNEGAATASAGLIVVIFVFSSLTATLVNAINRPGTKLVGMIGFTVIG